MGFSLWGKYFKLVVISGRCVFIKRGKFSFFTVAAMGDFECSGAACASSTLKFFN